MMKKSLVFLFLWISFSSASALTCVDLPTNVFRYEESDQVKTLQDFLYEKGYLKATPNGYFGPGTFAAIKMYQADNGISQTGTVGPLTRASIKGASGCTIDTNAVSGVSAITQAELAQGWYYAAFTGKKSGTPTNWVFANQGTRSEMWKAPDQDKTATSSVASSLAASAKLVCTDLLESLVTGNQSDAVLSLQTFLYTKEYLKVTPNGYFGPATFAAVSAYQKNKGITQTGAAGPLTRVAIKSDSCGVAAASTVSKPASVVVATTTKVTTTPASVATTTTTVSQPKPALTPSLPITKNERRWNDSETILRALYSYFNGTRGVWPVAVSTSSPPTPIELCVSPRITAMASSAEVTLVTTAASPCVGFVDVAYLSPMYIPTIPRDPNLATTSVLTGYTILRSEYGDITITPKVTDNKEIIRVRCNFTLGCPSVTKISQEEYGVPFVTTLSRTIVLRDSLPKSGITVTGRNFAATNTVFLQSKVNQRLYEVGTFPSTDGKTFVIAATTTSVEIPCGTGCSEKLPIGEYSVQVKHSGGESNIVYLTVKGFTTSSISARANSTVVASSSSVKLGTITVSASVPGILKSLTLRATSTSAKLPAKITNFKLKDVVSNKTISASGLTFSLSDTALSDNASRFYDLYADAGNILVDEAGYITYGGEFLMRDTIGGVDIDLPIKEISFSASP